MLRWEALCLVPGPLRCEGSTGPVPTQGSGGLRPGLATSGSGFSASAKALITVISNQLITINSITFQAGFLGRFLPKWCRGMGPSCAAHALPDLWEAVGMCGDRQCSPQKMHKPFYNALSS